MDPKGKVHSHQSLGAIIHSIYLKSSHHHLEKEKEILYISILKQMFFHPFSFICLLYYGFIQMIIHLRMVYVLFQTNVFKEYIPRFLNFTFDIIFCTLKTI